MARTDLEQLVYQMSADIKTLTSANRRALVDVKNTTAKAQREYDRLAAEMGQGFGRASVAAGVAFSAIVGYATKAASDASETANAFSVAFGSLENQAQAFAKSYSSDVGRALDETQASMAKTQLILTGVGVAAQDALGMTEAIQRRAVDIGSLWNVEDAVAYQAILSGISGEAEPLKRFGVALNEAALKAELLRLGFKGNAQDAPEAAKAIARLNIILKASASSDGDAIKTKDSLANATKKAQGEFRNAAVELGKNFLPTAALVVKAAADMLGELNKMPDSAKLAGLGLLALVAAGGPLTAVVTALSNVVKLAGAARLALATVAGASAVPAVAALGAPVGAAVATLSLSGDTRKFSTQDILNARLKTEVDARRKIAEYEAKSGASAERKLKFWQGVLANSQAEIRDIRARERAETRAGNRAAQRKKTAAGETVRSTQATPFTLSPDLLKPVSTPAPRAGVSAADKAEALADRQADRFNGELARAQDDELRSRQSLARSIEDQARNALERLDLDEKARAEDLRLAVSKKELTQAQSDLIKAAEAKARSADREGIQVRKEEDLAALRLRQAQEVAAYELVVLETEAALAQTFGERLAIERRILALRQSQEQAALDQDLATNPNLTDADKKARRRGLGRVQSAAVKALDESAIANLRSNILGAFEAARGGIGGLADYFGDRLKASLLESLADGLARKILGGGGSTGGEAGAGLAALSQIGRAFAGLFDRGGSIPAGKFGIAGERGAEFVKGPADVVGRLETLRAVRNSGDVAPRSTGGTTVVQHLHLDLSGAVLTQELLQQFNQMASASAMQGAQAGRAMARADFGRKTRSQIP